MGEKDAVARMPCGERFDQRRGGARLAARDRGDPDAARGLHGGVEAETLAEAIEIAALPARSPGEACDEQRSRQGPRHRIQETRHPSRAPKPIAAATASTPGALPAPP